MKRKAALIVSGILLMTGCSTNQPKNFAVPMNNLTCPVTGMPVNDTDTFIHEGREYKLCCGNCKAALLESPEKYLSK